MLVTLNKKTLNTRIASENNLSPSYNGTWKESLALLVIFGVLLQIRNESLREERG